MLLEAGRRLLRRGVDFGMQASLDLADAAR